MRASEFTSRDSFQSGCFTVFVCPAIRRHTVWRTVTISTQLRFPHPRDDEKFAWGLSGPGPEPVEVWERFSPAYEVQLERLVLTLTDMGFSPETGGAGSLDGEYVRAEYDDNSRLVFFYHLEVPDDARFVFSLDDSALRDWIIAGWMWR